MFEIHWQKIFLIYYDYDLYFFQLKPRTKLMALWYFFYNGVTKNYLLIPSVQHGTNEI